MKKVFGFDLAPTIAWYKRHQSELEHRFPKKGGLVLPFAVSGQEFAQLTKKDITYLWSYLPETARVRTKHLREIVWGSTLWFSKDSRRGSPRVTRDPFQAFSSTALVPSYILYGLPEFGHRIELYYIPERVCPPEVQRIIHREACLHEIAHVLIWDIWQEGRVLQLPDRRKLTGLEMLNELANLAMRGPPISHYSSVYWNINRTFPKKGRRKSRAISEELAETIAARLLGFAFCNDDDRSLDPFADRPEMAKAIDQFLEATTISL